VPTIYRIQPSSRQSEHAERLMGGGGGGKGKGSKEVGIKTVPIFTAKGMGVMKGNGRVRRVVFAVLNPRLTPTPLTPLERSFTRYDNRSSRRTTSPTRTSWTTGGS